MKLQVIFSKAKQLSKIIQFISLLLFFLFSKLSYGQLTYPVNVSTSVPGPSPMLADYQVSGRIVFNVNLNDMQIGSRDVKFKIKIESQGGGIAYSAISKTNVFSDKVTLYSGMPAVLKGEDLSELFDWENNLLISSPYQYASQGVMPEGLYTIKLIAYDYALGYQLSNAEIGFATLFISHLQPPILTLPLTQSNIDIEHTPLNSSYFSWIPRNNGAPIGKEIKYRLFIYPILNGQTAGTAINNTPVIPAINDIVNPFYTLEHSNLASYLASNTTRDFAWRVQAYFVDNNYNPIFANNGFSEIFTFTAYTPCIAPVLAPSTLNNSIPLQLTANWTEPSQSEFAGSELHYREKSRWTSWNLEQLPEGTHTKILNDLKADTYYEAMVRSVCTTGTRTYYSEWINFIDTKTDASTTSTVACIAPYNVQFSNTGSTININWTEGNEDRVSPVYTVQYKLKSTSSWTTASNNVTSTSYSLSSLPDGSYDIRVGSNCADFTVSYSDVYSLTVPVTGTLSSCNFPLPFELKVEVIEGREQTKISWPSDNNEQVYKFYFRKRFEEGAAWEAIITGVSYVIIDSLDYGESYECKIEKDCGGGVVVTSPTRYFQLDDPYLTSGNGTNNSGDCFPPDYATAAVKGTEEAPQIEFSWKANPNAQDYKLKYRIQGVTDFDSVTVNHPTNKYLLNLLEANLNQTYEYTVEARCDNKWSIPTQVNTIKLVIDPNMSASCDTIVIAAAQLGDTTMNSFKVRWTQIVSATGYIIEYRPLSASTPAWYSMPLIPQPTEPADPVAAVVDKLDQDAVYEYRVKTICGSDYSDYTNIRKIKTLKNEDVDCGSAGDDANLANQDPLLALEVNDEIHANDFTLTVTEVTSSAGGGVFSGQAEIELKLWGSLTFFAKFENAKFNTDYRLIDGKIIFTGAEAQYLPDEVRNTINSVITTIGDSFEKLQEVLDIIYDLGGIVRKDPVGQSAYNPALVTSPGETTGSIKVDKGTGSITNNASQFGVNSGTTIAVINKSEADAIKNTLPVSGSSGGTILDDATGKPSVNFSMASDQKFGYDAYQAGTGRLESVYENASGTYIDWKSIGAGLLDKINVTIGSGSTEEIAKIKFISLAGIEYKLQEKNGQKFILVSGSLEGTVQEIYAWYADETLTNKGLKIAKINVAAYKPKTNTVYLVPMKLTTAAPNPESFVAADVKNYLNGIYKSAVTEWDVQIKPIYITGTDWDGKSLNSSGALVGDNSVDIGNTDVLDAFTDEMNNLSSAYIQANNIQTQNNAYYLFYGLSPSDTDIKGFLPRGKNIGFIFDETSITVAHELGHGLTLNHTWDADAQPERGSTDNLMDYKTGTDKELWKSQWEIVAYPKVVVAFLESEEEGELLDVSNMEALRNFKDSDGSITFLAPSGAPFAISFSLLKSVTFSLDDLSGGSVDEPYYPNGTLFGFKLTNGEVYEARRLGTQFTGYKTPDGRFIYKDVFSKNHTTSASQNVCVGFPKIESGRYHFIIKKFSYDDDLLNFDDDWPTENHYGVGEFTTDLDVDVDDDATTATLNYARTSAEDQIFLRLNEGETDPDIIRACVKLSKIILANPGLYNAYVGCNTQIIYGYTEYKRTHSLPSGTYSFKPYYITYLSDPTWGLTKKFLDYKAGLLRQTASGWLATLTNLLKPTSNASSDDLYSHLGKIDCLDQPAATVYKSIPLDQRIKSLRILANVTYVGAVTEQYILDLLKNTPTSAVDQKNVLDNLVTSQYKPGSFPHLLAQLYDVVHGENFVLLTQEILRKALIAYPRDKNFTLPAAINQTKFIVFDPSTWFGDVVAKDFEDDGKITLQFREQFTFNTEEVTAHPYEYVYVKFEDVFKYGSGKTLTFNKGMVIALPACLMYSVFNEVNNKKIIAGSKLALDVGLCLLGVGEIKMALNAASTARKIFLTAKALADLAVGIGDIVISDFMIEELQNMPDEDGDGIGEGQEFLDNWYTFQLYYGVGSLTASGLDVLVRKIYQNGSDVKNVANVSEETAEQIDEMTNQLQTETRIANTVGGRSSLLSRLDDLDLPGARSFVNSLDETADAALLSRINNLSEAQLRKLNEFYTNLDYPAGYAGQFNYTASKVIEGENISVVYRNGLPDFSPYSPELTFSNGTRKFKYQSNTLNGGSTDFSSANVALANEFGIQKVNNQWPKNAQGFVETGNYRWKPGSQQFELRNSQGGWDPYTWHHFEDGRTLIPVKSSIHSKSVGGFNHSGGKSIITGNLKGLFPFLSF